MTKCNAIDCSKEGYVMISLHYGVIEDYSGDYCPKHAVERLQYYIKQIEHLV